MSILRQLSTMRGSVSITIVVLIIMLVVIIGKVFDINIVMSISNFIKWVVKKTGRLINKKEARYHRDIEIGKINEKTQQVKIYRFLNDLIIDLGLKRKGATPYEFLTIVIVISIMLALAFGLGAFRNIILSVILTPIIIIGLMSVLYTKANIAHDMRIENIIEAENIISNSIKDGVVVAVRNNLNSIPLNIRSEFIDFLDNMEHKNYYIKTALRELNNNLGSTADDFIKKCIVFETEEEHGYAEMFRDVVEINNVKTEMRTQMKRQFEAIVTEFIIGATMIFVFLGGVIAIFPNIAYFYFRTMIGQIIICIDILIIVGEFVYITYLRAKEL